MTLKTGTALGAKWITFQGCEAPHVKKEFVLKNGILNASVRICGLGFFELYLNGRKVSDDVLTPVWSDYEKREEMNLLYPLNAEFTHRVYYRVYDVASWLKTGENLLEVYLGNGWYNQHERNVEGTLRYGEPKLYFELTAEEENGTVVSVVSDKTALWKPGPVIFNNIYYGEIQDFRMCGCGEWQYAEEVSGPDAEFAEQKCPPDRVIREIVPKLISGNGMTGGQDGGDSLRIYDCGENISGWVRFELSGTADSRVIIQYSETIKGDGSLDFKSCGGDGQVQKDEYIGDGEEHICEPKFTWHGFRYFSVQCLAGQQGDVPVLNLLRAVVVHADVSVTSQFGSSSDGLNWIYRSYLRTQLSNMHCGVVSDCPHRERLGYTGDGQLVCDTAMLLLDGEEFYKKWIQDIADCQDKKTGRIQHTAPFYGGGGGPAGWGCAIITVPYYHYRHYGDVQILRKYYPNMLKWLAYIEAHSEAHLVVSGEKGGWFLGDWCTPDEVVIDPRYVNTYYYVKSLERMEEIAGWIGEASDGFGRKAELAKEAVRREFYDAKENTFCGGIQGADAFALDIGLGNGAMADRLAAYYDGLNAFDTGIFGTDVLLSVLFEYGHADTAFRLLTSCEKNSFGDQRKKGATTFWESWDGRDSHSHPMFGACAKYLFYNLLGIRVNGSEVRIEPEGIWGLERISGSVKTGAGVISVEYEKTETGWKAAVESEADAEFVWNGMRFEVAGGKKCGFIL